MLRKRIIFSLIYSEGFFMQSRNFRLQKVGDLKWLEKNYDFSKISSSIDELIIVDASRHNRNFDKFCNTVSQLRRNVFIPVAVGGGLNSMDKVEKVFKSGADKLVINTALYTNPNFIYEVKSKYGSQSILSSIDYNVEQGVPVVYIDCGRKKIEEINLSDYIKMVIDLGVGEIVLNSIQNDGTGFGYDFHTIDSLLDKINIPLIIIGGAGNEKHLSKGLSYDNVSAVATANLFNFIGNGLPLARKALISQGNNISSWNYAI